MHAAPSRRSLAHLQSLAAFAVAGKDTCFLVCRVCSQEYLPTEQSLYKTHSTGSQEAERYADTRISTCVVTDSRYVSGCLLILAGCAEHP